MPFGLPTDKRGQTFLLVSVLALASIYGVFSYLHMPAREQIVSIRAQLDTIDSVVRMAKAELAKGSKDQVERQNDGFRAMLVLMRQLVPEGNEVPTLIDDMSNRAKIRAVTIGRFQPVSVEPGHPFDTHRYRFEIYGRYDQIGEFLSDVASLARIVVPEEVVLRPAQQQTQRFLNDTSGALLEATFSIRTFVKSAGPAAPRSGGVGEGEGGSR